MNLTRGGWTGLGVTASLFTDMDRVTLMSPVCCWTLSWCCAVEAHGKCNGKTLCPSRPYSRAAAEAGHPRCARYDVLHRPTEKSSKGLVEARAGHVQPKPRQRLSLPVLSVHTLRARRARGQGPGEEDRRDLLASGRPCSILGAVLAEKLGVMGPRAGRKGSPQHPALSPHPDHSHRTNQNIPQKEEGTPDVLLS